METFNALGVNAQPSWSPNGKRIAFASSASEDRRSQPCKGRHLDIWVMNADGSGKMQLTESPEEELFPAWSPNGQKIAFARMSEEDGVYDIYVMDSDGSNIMRLTENCGSNLEPSWSPDGSKIAFVSVRDGNYEVYVMDADGQNEVRLTHNPADDTSPSWLRR